MEQILIDNRYTLDKPLGSGGMAEVYLAHDEVLDRDVALKILRRQYADDEEFVGRFRQEARSAASLSHPNIVSIYDQGRSEDGSYYIAMECVSGGTLKERIRREGALAPSAAAGVALQISEALSEAHEKGIVHRDVKPHNVLITETGDVKVTDFGIARAASSPATVSSAILGTAGYMSPEQAMGKAVGPRSDLYSLGVVLYEMLAGNLPFEADSAVALALKHVSELPPSPRESNPGVSEALDALTTKLLAKDPEDRYKSADALANDLERVRSGFPLAAEALEKTEKITVPLPPSPEGRSRRMAVQPPVAAPVKAPKRGRRRRGRLLAALATLLFGIVLLGGLIWALQNLGAPSLEEPDEDRSVTEDTAPSKVQVPDLVYASTAANDLAAVGLELGRWSEVPSNTVPAGLVIESNPPEGTEAEVGSTVDIFVSTGPQQQATPVQQVPAAQTAPAAALPAHEKPKEEEDRAENKREEEEDRAENKREQVEEKADKKREKREERAEEKREKREED